jgi:YD repeat-containing protein
VEADRTSTWRYDSTANGIGKLDFTQIVAGPDAGFNRWFLYDALGRPTEIGTTIDGAQYRVNATYDGNSRLATVRYPSGQQVAYDYTALGYAFRLRTADNSRTTGR